MRTVHTIILVLAVVAIAMATWAIQTKPLREGTFRRYTTASADGSAGVSNQLVSPRQVFLKFVVEASQHFPNWTPRCELISNLCGAHGGEAAHVQLMAVPGACGALPPAVICPSGQCAVDDDRSVWFNPIAANYIASIRNSGGVPAAIAFPRGSIIARPVWGIVRNDGSTAASIAQMPIYDPPRVVFCPDFPSANQVSLFPHKSVNLKDESCNLTTASASIPVGCFFHLKNLQDVDIKRYQTDRLSIRAGDTIVLLGFHLIAKDCVQPSCQLIEWKFATFWWQESAVGPSPEERCQIPTEILAQVPPAWRHYVMKRVVLPANPNDCIGPVMNPYIEGGVKNNKNLNCIVCHSFAAVPMKPSDVFNVQLGAQGPTTKVRVQQTRNAYIAGKTSTDGIWSVAMMLNPQPSK